MAYSFDRDETVGEGLLRCAESQGAEALHRLDHPDDEGLVESVHDVRKRCKKLRALARMVRPHIGHDRYRATNVAFRDAARELSDVRDAQVLVEIVDDLVASAPDDMELPDLDPVLRELRRRCEEAVATLEGDGGRLDRARALLEDGLDQVRAWEVDDGFESLAGGIGKTYGRAVKARRKAAKEPTTPRLHEWRKRVKYHWYHLRMLSGASPAVLGAWADGLHDLSDALGDDHDLAVLVEGLTADPDAFAADEADTVRLLAEGRRAVLQETAFALGARLTAEDPDAVVDRLRIQWEAWKAHGDVPAVTELTDLPA